MTIVDGKNDQNTQTEQINTFLQQGVDVLIINCSDHLCTDHR